jgi:hypothetical protein
MLKLEATNGNCESLADHTWQEEITGRNVSGECTTALTRAPFLSKRCVRFWHADRQERRCPKLPDVSRRVLLSLTYVMEEAQGFVRSVVFASRRRWPECAPTDA